MADHNDPNAVNSIFSDIDYSAADLYDMFGFPTHDGRTALLALTFAATPKAGVLDSDLLYRLLVTSHPRVAFPEHGDESLQTVLRYFDAVKERYLGGSKAAEICVTVQADQTALVKFIGFPLWRVLHDCRVQQGPLYPVSRRAHHQGLHRRSR